MANANESSTKFIGRNRKPRVHIEYEVFTDGAAEKVSLPFVMGVMADLAGRNRSAQPTLNERKFLEFDHENFDNRMEAMAPSVALQVDNKLTGEGKLGVNLTFKSMDDFSPDNIARNVEPLNRLLTIRKQLDELLTEVGGREAAEQELDALLQALRSDPAFKLGRPTGAQGA